MVAAILTMAINGLLQGALGTIDPWLAFHGDVTGLVAFGVSRLTASRMLPVITGKDERLSLFNQARSAALRAIQFGVSPCLRL